jgi:hypothetical protein
LVCSQEVAGFWRAQRIVGDVELSDKRRLTGV